ncbi:MAG TPA: tRNA lysidine(34) synthetase TilS [Humisphaera sp.]
MPPDAPLDRPPLIVDVPPGRWAVGVSGGADSVALLRLAAGRADVSLHVVHLNHQTRGGESDADAAFVNDLASRLGLPATVAARGDVEAGLSTAERDALPANPSARYRALRHALFRSTVAVHALHGVLLAHHADDQAETVLLRLLRGSGYAALAGMAGRSAVGGLALVRPLLGVRRDALRAYLAAIGQPWREDASNAGDDYARNRARKAMAAAPGLTPALLAVAEACAALRDWTDRHAPALPDEFPAARLAGLPDVLATAAAAGWLRRQGVGGDAASPAHVAAVLSMCRDAASPSRHAAPDGVEVRRRRGSVSAAVTRLPVPSHGTPGEG